MGRNHIHLVSIDLLREDLGFCEGLVLAQENRTSAGSFDRVITVDVMQFEVISGTRGEFDTIAGP